MKSLILLMNSKLKRKLGKIPDQTLGQREYMVTTNHMVRCSAAAAIREMQIKTTARCNAEPFGMTRAEWWKHHPFLLGMQAVHTWTNNGQFLPFKYVVTK
jgi:hypothetical protein